jgi:hypothetical protein
MKLEYADPIKIFAGASPVDRPGDEASGLVGRR